MSAAAEPEVMEPEVVAPGKATKKGKPSNGTQALATRPPTVEDLMSQALAGGADIETLERLFALRQTIKAERDREAFFTALSAFQAECPIIKKTKEVMNRAGTGVIYRYAPLDAIIKVVAPLLTRHGLSYNITAHVEPPSGKADALAHIVAQCHIYHSAGHKEFSEFRVPIQPTDFTNQPQQFGTANTYAKRYAFCNAFGILTGDEDTDAGGRVSPQQAREARQPVRQPQQTPSAQKANGAKEPKVKADLEPAGEGESIDGPTIEGLTKAMTNAALGDADFKKRFPKLELGLEQVKKSDARAVMSWIASPNTN